MTNPLTTSFGLQNTPEFTLLIKLIFTSGCCSPLKAEKMVWIYLWLQNESLLREILLFRLKLIMIVSKFRATLLVDFGKIYGKNRTKSGVRYTQLHEMGQI